MSIGADPITAAVVTMSAVRGTPLPGFMVRKEPKGHGTNQYLEGPVTAGRDGGDRRGRGHHRRLLAAGDRAGRGIRPEDRPACWRSSTAWKAAPRRSPGAATRSPACFRSAISASSRRRRDSGQRLAFSYQLSAVRGCELFDFASPWPQSVGCVKRTIHYGLWCVSRTLQ